MPILPKIPVATTDLIEEHHDIFRGDLVVQGSRHENAIKLATPAGRGIVNFGNIDRLSANDNWRPNVAVSVLP